MKPSSQHIAPQDTTAHDSAAVDTSQLYHAPLYTDSFPELTAADSVATPLSQGTVMQPPKGDAAGPRGHSLIHDTGSMMLLLASLFFLVVSYRTGYKYLENLAHNMFSVRRRDSLFEAGTVNETQILSALIGLTCTMEGLLGYQAISLFNPSLSAGMHQSMWQYVGLFVVVALVFYLVQIVVYHLLGFIFSDRDSTRVWLDGFKASQSLLGLLLFPAVAVSLAAPQTVKGVLILASILYICTRFIFICKGFRIFYSNLLSLVYFILYLCSVEIVPLSITYRVTMQLCHYLQS
ncbi:MAG: DUF4271 domain-containing protein [Muribaculaceae bacterium]|nr:DUF4271 domain-containing protein [Muribaculaceae bacterium]